MQLEQKIKEAAEKFAALVQMQLERNERIKAEKEFTDYKSLDKIIVGVCGGDGIGPIITNEAARVLQHLLADDVKSGRIEFCTIDGLTIENRAAQHKAIPDDVLAELKKCHVILKGPTTTPRAAVLCIPKEVAFETTQRLMELGVNCFWNFSHYDLSLDFEGVIVENVHLGDSLMTLSYQINEAYPKTENQK